MSPVKNVILILLYRMSHSTTNFTALRHCRVTFKIVTRPIAQSDYWKLTRGILKVYTFYCRRRVDVVYNRYCIRFRLLADARTLSTPDYVYIAWNAWTLSTQDNLYFDVVDVFRTRYCIHVRCVRCVDVVHIRCCMCCRRSLDII